MSATIGEKWGKAAQDENRFSMRRRLDADGSSQINHYSEMTKPPPSKSYSVFSIPSPPTDSESPPQTYPAFLAPDSTTFKKY